jgi:adenine-specific DNA-methyltransferase
VNSGQGLVNSKLATNHSSLTTYFQVEVFGFDYFDTQKSDIVSGGKNKIAMWLLDTDYDERLTAYHGTVSLPFAAGKNRKVAVKLIDDRGIESLKILPLA